MGLLQLLAPDQTTVLWDFDDPTGAANPSTVATDLKTSMDMGTIEPVHDVFTTTAPGGMKLATEYHPVEMLVPFTASAATDDALWAGLGQLARYLAAAASDHPAVLKWTDLTEARYIDVLGALNLPALLRGQRESGLISVRKNSMGPIPLRLLRQPWARGPQVSVSGVTVPDDPATSTKARVFPLTVAGDLPTPAQIRVQIDAASSPAVERVLIAHRARGSRAATFLTDYTAETGFLQLEADGRGWTVTRSNDTSTATDANASPGSGTSVARIAYTTDPAVPKVRIHATRTTKLDSLRGAWDVWIRVKAAAARDYRLQLRWSPSVTTTPAFTLKEIKHDTSAQGTPAAFGYVEKNLGRIVLPQQGTLGGLTLDVWSYIASGTAQNLDCDLIWLVPAYDQGTIVTVGGSSTVTLGNAMASPVSNPAGGTAGTVQPSKGLALDTSTDNVGLSPNTGIVYPAGHHRVRYRLAVGGDPKTAKLNVRNITGSSDAASRTVTINPGTADFYLEFDANGTSAYQPQVDDPSALIVVILEIEVTYIPALGSGESARTDPARYTVDRLDSSGNVSGFLGNEGELPAILAPGDNQIMVRCDDIPLALYEEGENKLGRTPTVSVIYDPRYAL